jgi:hypothetical protein
MRWPFFALLCCCEDELSKGLARMDVRGQSLTSARDILLCHFLPAALTITVLLLAEFSLNDLRRGEWVLMARNRVIGMRCVSGEC